MKVGIVVPFSWSFWGAVTEHGELSAEALRGIGIETRTIIGNDPPGSFTRILHPRPGRHDTPSTNVIPVGRTVIAPANGSLPNIVLNPPALRKIRRALERRKGIHVLLRAWPKVRRRTGARLRIAGADPLAVRLLIARLRVPDEGIDVLGLLSQQRLTEATAAFLEDEPRRRVLGAAGRRLAVERYSWDRIAARLAEVSEHVAAARVPVAAPTRPESVPA